MIADHKQYKCTTFKYTNELHICNTMKAKIFTDKEKEFLDNKKSVPKEQRGILQKRIKERMEEVTKESFREACNYLEPIQKYELIKSVLYSMNTKQSKLVLENLSSEIKSLDKTHSGAMKKLTKRSHTYEEIKDRIDGELSFEEVSTLMKELNAGSNLLQTIAKIKKNPEYTFRRKAAFDNQYLFKDKRAMEVFKLILSKRKITDNDFTFKELKPGIIKRYLMGFVERGIISCELTKKKNFLKDCQKILFKMEKEGTGRAIGVEIAYKIIPYQGVFKDKKKSYTFEVTEYTKNLSKNLKKPLNGIKVKGQVSGSTS